jgi:RimJ/RimL family protein N-acetyltransferase
MTLPIQTDRLILRRFTHDDVQDVIAFVSHPSVARATPEIEPTESGVIQYIDRVTAYRPFEQGKCFDLALERKQDGRVIGLVGLIRKEHQQGEIGWALGVDYRGQGYATEAARALITRGFATLGLHRIYADTTSANVSSWKVMERLGMRREAYLREAERRDGEWVDIVVYAILVAEWQPTPCLSCRPG